MNLNDVANVTHRKRLKALIVAILLSGIAASLITALGRSGNAAKDTYPVFLQQFFFDDAKHSIAMLGAFVFALCFAPARRLTAALAKGIETHPTRACAITFAAMAVVSQLVYQTYPYSMDEYAPLLQARAFATGSLTANYPPALLDLIVHPAFQGVFIVVNKTTGHAMSAYWPGFALLMAPFAFLYLESCLNPAISAVTLWLIGDLAVRASGNSGSRGWAMLAALASPQFTVNAISLYAMPGLLALNLLFLWLLLRPKWHSALLAGLVGGFALAFHNPVPHTLMAIPCVAWLLLDRARRGRLLPLALGYLPMTILLVIGWPMLTSAMGMARIHTDIVAADHGFFSEWLARISNYLFVAPTMELLLVRWYSTWKTWIWLAPGLILLPFLIKRRGPDFWILAMAAIGTFLFYLFVPFDQGYGWGYRYIHPAWGLFPICAGIWIVQFKDNARILGTSMVAAGILATPIFFWNAESTVTSALTQRLTPPPEGRWVVFVSLPPTPPNIELIQNYPGRERILYLVSQGEKQDAKVMQAIIPSAAKVEQDSRGSMWRVPDRAGGHHPQPAGR